MIDLDRLAALAEAVKDVPRHPSDAWFDDLQDFRQAADPATVLALIARAREAELLEAALLGVRESGFENDSCWCHVEDEPLPTTHTDYCLDARAALAQPDAQEEHCPFGKDWCHRGYRCDDCIKRGLFAQPDAQEAK